MFKRQAPSAVAQHAGDLCAAKLGRKPVRDIDLQDVLEVLQPIWLSKTETASRVRGRIENVLSWAAVRGYRSSDNPARWKGNLSELLPKPSKIAKVTNQPSLSQGDAAAWWADLQNRDGMAALALRFQTLTAARSGEVRTASWEDFALATALQTRFRQCQRTG